jgi:hypothetical protein
MNPKPQQSHLPEGSRAQAFLIYDRKSGEIVHGHMEVLLPGVEPPSSDVLSRQALESAAQAIDRDISTLNALAVDFGELKPGTHYRVDVNSGRLQAAAAK